MHFSAYIVFSLPRGCLEGTQFRVAGGLLLWMWVKCQHPKFGFYGVQMAFKVETSYIEPLEPSTCVFSVIPFKSFVYQARCRPAALILHKYYLEGMKLTVVGGW